MSTENPLKSATKFQRLKDSSDEVVARSTTYRKNVEYRKFGPKGTDPNMKDARFSFTRGALCSRR